MKVKLRNTLQNGDKKLNLPKYTTKGSAGFDLSSAEDILILPGQVVAVDTGFAFEIPIGYEMQIRSRSGLAIKSNLFVLNAPGTIDSDFRGSVKVILCNASNQNFSIRAGDRIAQGKITPVVQAIFIETDDLEQTERGEKGFGSTGIKSINI